MQSSNLISTNKIPTLALVLILVSVTALTGCLDGGDDIECGEGTKLVDGKCVADTPSYSGKLMEFDVVAAQFDFVPNELVVNEGDRVKITFTSTMDIQSQYQLHSFSLNAYDIAVDLPVGETVVVEFDADQVGEFAFDCSIFCGDRHNDMIGTLIVKAKDGGTEVEVPEIGNHTALDPKTEVYVNGGTPDWENHDLMLIVERENESVAFVDTSRNIVVGRVIGLGFQPHTAVYDPEEEFGYLISRGGWLSKINLDDLTVEKYVKVGESSRGSAMSITQDGRWIMASNYEPSSFIIVDSDTMEVAMEYQVPIPWSNGEREFSRVASLIDTPEGLLFAAMKDLGQVWVIDLTRDNFPVAEIFHEAGGMLHDAFLSPDGKYYMLASQTSDHMLIIDVENLTEVGKVPTGLKPHPGPGAIWGKYAFTPSIGEGVLNIINMEDWTLEHAVEVGGPALFTRTYKFGDEGKYPYVWWDTVLSTDLEQNKEIYVLNASLIGEPGTTNASLAAATHVLKYEETAGRTLHPEFSYDGKYVYISNWQPNGSLLVYEAFPDSGMATHSGVANDPAVFDIITIIENIADPTGKFQVGLRAEEIGV